MKPTPPEPDEVALLLAVARQDEAAFAALYDRMARPIFSLVLRIVRVRAEAEEVLQEAFWQIWESAPSYRSELGTPFCWMVTVARRKAIDRLRARGPLAYADQVDDMEIEDGSVPADALLASAQDAQALGRCLGELDERTQKVIRTAFFEGVTYEALAQRMDTPLGTVKSWIRRGLLKLRGCLEP